MALQVVSKPPPPQSPPSFAPSHAPPRAEHFRPRAPVTTSTTISSPATAASIYATASSPSNAHGRTHPRQQPHPHDHSRRASPQLQRSPEWQAHRAQFARVLSDMPSAAHALHLARLQRSPPPPTVFVLDWDDTCHPTSYLERVGLMAAFEESHLQQQQQHGGDAGADVAQAHMQARVEDGVVALLRPYLAMLEHRVLTLLKRALALGIVLIVTNAGDGWVQLSSATFLPAVHAFLKRHSRHIKIVSARARYIGAHRGNPLQWKALTFADELRPLRKMAGEGGGNGGMHVVVLGDSVGDQYAAHVAADVLAGEGMPVTLKVVKFLERPTVDQLCKEVGVLLDHLEAMTVHAAAFDVTMYKEPAGGGAQAAAAGAMAQQQHVLQAARQQQEMMSQQQQQQQHEVLEQQQQHAEQTAAAIVDSGTAAAMGALSAAAGAGKSDAHATPMQAVVAEPCVAAV